MEQKLTKDAFRQEIEWLLQLQERDMKLRGLLADKADHPRRLAALRESFKGTGRALEQAKEELKQLQAAMKKLELDVKTNQDNILKYSAQLFQVKTNQEYQALDKEIQHLKQANSQLEDQIIEDLMKIDEANKKVAGKQAELAVEEKKLKEQEVLVQERLKNIEQEIAQLGEGRQKLAAQVNEEVLSIYERVFRNKPDIAVVGVENYTCLGCHMSLTHQVTTDVKRGTEIVRCENCSRILYLVS